MYHQFLGLFHLHTKLIVSKAKKEIGREEQNVNTVIEDGRKVGREMEKGREGEGGERERGRGR